MIPRVTVTGTCLIQEIQKNRTSHKIEPTRPAASRLLLRKTAVALVLLSVSVAALKAQEPAPWPPDDDYAGQPQPGYDQPQITEPQYTQPYNNSQSAPQPDYGTDPYAGQQQYGQQSQYDQQPQYGQQPQYMPSQALNPQQLEQLLAPIALYPDALVAQILAASTYPAQIASADQWLRSMGAAPPDQIAAAANAQTGWDPSVKALTAYPQVLSWMNQNLQWTTALGNAYYNQPQDVLETMQVLRQRAQAAGNLQSTPQEQVANNDGYITVAPTNPEVIYVPTYNPWAIYGQPVVAYPGFMPLDAVGAVVGATVQFGLNFAVGAFLAPFNLLGWGLDWIGHSIFFGDDVWCSHSYSVHDWGFPYGGPRAYAFARYGDRFGHGGYGRFGGHDRFGGYGHGGGYGGGYGRGGLNAYRNQPGYGRGGGQFPVARPGGGYGPHNPGGYNRGANFPPARPGQGTQGRYLGGSSRGSLGYNGGSGRGLNGFGGPAHPVAPGQQYAYNRGSMPTAIGRPQPYRGNPQPFGNGGQRSAYGAQPYTRPPQISNYGQGFGNGSRSLPRATPGYGGGQGYRMPSQPYRAPTPSFGRGVSRPPSNAYAGNFGHSGGGFHPFGGGHNSSPSFGGGRSYGGGGGHSFFGGGGHSSGGGGHSFFGGGGGHSFGGGHSGGGHSGGGHSGGGGHGRR